jgi:hypothetical protein
MLSEVTLLCSKVVASSDGIYNKPVVRLPPSNGKLNASTKSWRRFRPGPPRFFPLINNSAEKAATCVGN